MYFQKKIHIKLFQTRLSKKIFTSNYFKQDYEKGVPVGIVKSPFHFGVTFYVCRSPGLLYMQRKPFQEQRLKSSTKWTCRWGFVWWIVQRLSRCHYLQKKSAGRIMIFFFASYTKLIPLKEFVIESRSEEVNVFTCTWF